MREYECYINKRGKEIKKLILFVGESFACGKLAELVRRTTLEDIILTGSITQVWAERLLEQLKGQDASALVRLNSIRYLPADAVRPAEGEKWALLFSDIDDDVSSVFQMWDARPFWMFGEMRKNSVDSFDVWETFRKCCDFIQIVTYQQDAEPHVLEWKKRPDTDVELSVVFPMYNVEKYLDQCVRSVTAWDADYVEFLFVNDGSPDHSRDIILKYQEKDSRILLLDKPNGGCASARQYGLKRAQGNYVGFIDPDDYIDETMFQKLLRAAMEGSFDISYCGYKEYYDNTGEIQEIPDVLGAPYNRGTTDKRAIQDLIGYLRIAIWRGIYKMDMLEKSAIHFYTELRRFDDLPFKVEVYAAAQSVIAVEEYLYYYRLSRPGQDVAADDERLYVHFPIFKHLDDSVGSKKDYRLNDKLLQCKVHTHRYALEKIKPELVAEYVKQAREDLSATDTGSFLRTVDMVRCCIGKRCMLYYIAIRKNNLALLKILRKWK